MRAQGIKATLSIVMDEFLFRKTIIGFELWAARIFVCVKGVIKFMDVEQVWTEEIDFVQTEFCKVFGLARTI